MNCDLTPSINRFVGVDYGQRRIAWVVLNKDAGIEGIDELALPEAKHETCHMCHLGMMADYVDGNLTDKWCTPRTLVTIEMPIMVASPFVQTKMAMVAGMVVASISRSTDKHMLVPPGTWKKNLTGHGDATKDDVHDEVFERYINLGRHRPDTSFDITDSAGIALWGLNQWQLSMEVTV